MAVVGKPFSRSSVVVERKNFLINFNLDKLLSSLATLIGRVSNILKTIPRFGAKSRYLATGDLMASLSYLYRIGRSTTSAIIKETCEAISSSLKPIVQAKPDRTKWLDIAEAYYEQWQFPNCLGAIDGKHVLMQNFRKPLISSLESSTFTVAAAVCLHNYIKSAEGVPLCERRYCPFAYADNVSPDGNINDGRWRTEEAFAFNRLSRTGSNLYSGQAEDIRRTLLNYFCHEGATAWQDAHIAKNGKN
ncbi:uncharacterized protein TNCV_4240751 [Trichonephila clavipes]|nr:uncharacterized protein TNCV_4240751 [Trichonephila clavipes]